MTAAPALPTTKGYCNILARERGLDPAGHAGHFQDAVLLEVPLPWKRDLMGKAGALAPEILNLLAVWLQDYRDGKGYPHRPLVIAPDERYSRVGYRRVMFYTRPAGAFAQFDKTEYLVPTDQQGGLVWAWYQTPELLTEFERYRVPEADMVRDILVCTHGTVDAACAKFGYPLYRHLRDEHGDTADLRVWRCSHFGGHVFAPTLMEMPTGHYWAYIEPSQADQIARREGDVAQLRGHYRGWAGLDGGFLQTAERDLWQQYGWDWFGLNKRGETLSQDPDPENPLWAEVRITHDLPDGGQATHDFRIEVKLILETEVSTGDNRTYAYPQYVSSVLSLT